MKILIYAPNWIGDAVMALPMIRRTRKAFPGAEFTVFARDWVAPVYRFLGEVDLIVEFSRDEIKSFWSRRRIIKSLKQEDYDQVFLLPDSFSTAMTMFRARIPERIGYTGQFRSWMLTRRYPLDIGRTMHRSDKYCHLLTGYADNVEMGSPPRFDGLEVGPVDLPDSWDKSAITIGINPHSVATSRRWPEEYWVQLFESFTNENIQFVIFGGVDARSIGDSIRSQTSAAVLNQAGKTTLKESIRLMGECRIFISNDSGPMHIADAAGVPTIGLWGAGNTAKTGLRSEHSVNINADVYCSPCEKNHCINKEEPMLCMHSVTPDWVRDSAKDMLNSARPGGGV